MWSECDTSAGEGPPASGGRVRANIYRKNDFPKGQYSAMPFKKKRNPLKKKKHTKRRAGFYNPRNVSDLTYVNPSVNRLRDLSGGQILRCSFSHVLVAGGMGSTGDLISVPVGANCAFDPLFEAVASPDIQPMLYDQLSLWYSNYRVTRSWITVKFSSLRTTLLDTPMVVGIYVQQNATTPTVLPYTSYTEIMENPRSLQTVKIIPNGLQDKPTTCKMHWNIKSLGDTTALDAQGAFGTAGTGVSGFNPTSVQTYQIFAQPQLNDGSVQGNDIVATVMVFFEIFGVYPRIIASS